MSWSFAGLVDADDAEHLGAHRAVGGLRHDHDLLAEPHVEARGDLFAHHRALLAGLEVAPLLDVAGHVGDQPLLVRLHAADQRAERHLRRGDQAGQVDAPAPDLHARVGGDQLRRGLRVGHELVRELRLVHVAALDAHVAGERPGRLLDQLGLERAHHALAEHDRGQAEAHRRHVDQRAAPVAPDVAPGEADHLSSPPSAGAGS
jgi:hypothetical protein